MDATLGSLDPLEACRVPFDTMKVFKKGVFSAVQIQESLNPVNEVHAVFNIMDLSFISRGQ